MVSTQQWKMDSVVAYTCPQSWSVQISAVICSVCIHQVASVQALTTIPTTRPMLGLTMKTGKTSRGTFFTFLICLHFLKVELTPL